MKLLGDLEHNDCRWPIEKPEGRFFCAEPIWRKSYCGHHSRIAYPPAGQKSYALPAPRKRVAETKSGEIHSVPEEQPEAEAVDCVDAMERADG